MKQVIFKKFKIKQISDHHSRKSKIRNILPKLIKNALKR